MKTFTLTRQPASRPWLRWLCAVLGHWHYWSLIPGWTSGKAGYSYGCCRVCGVMFGNGRNYGAWEKATLRHRGAGRAWELLR